MLAESAPNTGAYQWAVPADLDPNGKYQVELTSTADSSHTVASATYFSLPEKPSTDITVIAPNGSETWQKGTTHTIQWARADGGENVRLELVKGRKLHSVPWFWPFGKKTILVMLLIGLVNFTGEHAYDQNLVQRYCAAKSAKEARKALWIECCSSLPIWVYFYFVGTGLYVFFKHFPTPESLAMLTGVQDAAPERILPFFVMHYLPAGVAGLVLAAVAAAAMSSLDSSINAISTVGVVDMYRRHMVKGRSDDHYLLAARSIAIGASVFMIGGAMLFAYFPNKTLSDTTTALAAIVSGGLLGLYLFGFLTTKGDARAINVAIGCTIVWSLYKTLGRYSLIPESGKLPIDDYYTGILGHLLMFVVALVCASLFFRRPHRDLRNLSIWTQDKTPLE